MAQKRKGLLLLDIDNTLIDRDGAFARYAKDFIARHPGAWGDETPEQVHVAFLLMDAHGRRERSLFCREVLRRYPDLPYNEASLWRDHGRLPDFVVPNDALFTMLSSLSLQFECLVVSNGSGMMQRRKLQQAGLTSFFPRLLLSGEIGYAKPSAEIFLLALDGTDPECAIMVGDDVVNDILPARALGIKTLLLETAAETDFTSADAHIRYIHELEDALACMLTKF